MAKLGDVINDDQLSAVFFRDGSRQFVAQGQGEALPVAVESVAFAASLRELTELVSEMRDHMESEIETAPAGELVLKSSANSK